MELTWTAEGGSDETTITTGNSGGSSGTAWDTVNIGADATLVYDTAQASHGSLSMRHATGATSTTANAIWDTAIGTPVARLYGRIYIRSADMTSSRSIMRVRTGTTQIVRLQINASGELELRNSANSAVDTSTTVLSDNTWYRIEFDVRPGNPVTNTVNLYVGDSTSLTESLSASSDFSSGTTIDEFGVGNFAAGSNSPATWFDSIQINDSALPGPATTNATPTPAAIAATVATPAASVSAGSTPVPAAIAAVVAAPAASVSAAATVTPAAIAATVALPAATVTTTARLHSLVDNFDDNSIDTTLWPGNYGGVAESGGRFVIDCDSAQWSGLKSATRYILTDSQVSIRAYPAAANTATVAYLSVLVTTTTAGTDAGFNIDTASNGIAFLSRTGFSDPDAVFATYSATDHAWLRLRESAGTLHWETSADGQTWTSRRTDDTPAWAADEDLALLCEAHRDAGTDNTAEVDNVNVIPATVTPAVTAVTVALPAATVSAGSTVTPAATATTAALPAAAVSLGATAAPDAVPVVVALPAATVDASGSATVNPAATAAVVALPAADPSAGATTAPDAIVAVVALPAATLSAGSTPTPAAIAAAAALPAVTLSAGATVEPAAITAATALPASAVSAGATIVPATTAAVASLPAVTLSAGSTITPATVAAIVALPAATTSAGSTATPATVAVVVALPAAGLSLGATLTPAAIAVITDLPAVTVLTVIRNLLITLGPPAPKWTTGPPAAKWRVDGPDPKWTTGAPTT